MKSLEAPDLQLQLPQAWMWVKPSLTLLSKQLFLQHRSWLARHFLKAALRDYYLPTALLPHEENRNVSSKPPARKDLRCEPRGVL